MVDVTTVPTLIRENGMIFFSSRSVEHLPPKQLQTLQVSDRSLVLGPSTDRNRFPPASTDSTKSDHLP